MAETQKAGMNNKQVTRQDHKEKKEIIEELSGKSYAGKSILLMILRIVVVIVILVVAAIVGAMVGYGIIGDGEIKDVLKLSTWTHVFDIMNGTEAKK